MTPLRRRMIEERIRNLALNTQRGTVKLAGLGRRRPGQVDGWRDDDASGPGLRPLSLPG